MKAIARFLEDWLQEAAAPPAEAEAVRAVLKTRLRPYLLDWLDARAELDPLLTRALFVTAGWVPASTRLAQLPALKELLGDALPATESEPLADAVMAKLRTGALLFDLSARASEAEAIAGWRKRLAGWPRCLERIFWLDLAAAESLALAESLGGSPYASPERAELPGE